ncbi:MAG: hypothetical protein ABJM06_07335 [Gilvibacter sp.]
MTIVKRFVYFLGGMTVGIILLMFFLGGKNTSCDYGPNARVLKNIRIKSPEIAPQAEVAMGNYGLDTTTISSFLNKGDVIFKESNLPINDSCKLYVIKGKSLEKLYKMKVQNCDSTAVILAFEPIVEN